VRFGQVHVFNNYYKLKDGTPYSYSWGVGIESAIFAQNNFFWTNGTETPDTFISVFRGTAIHAEGTLVDGLSSWSLVDVVAAYNAVNDPDLSGDVGWTPTLFRRIDRTALVPLFVRLYAGTFPCFFGCARD
jgi:pectate lyase